MGSCFWKVAVTAIALSLTVPAAAEPGRRSDKRAELHDKMREHRGRVLRERVGLDEKTAQATEKILDRFQLEREKLEAQQREEKKKLRAMLELDQNDQAAYTRGLRSLVDAQQKLGKLRQQELDELAKVLTPKQQAKLALAIDEAMKELRKRLRGGD